MSARDEVFADMAEHLTGDGRRELLDAYKNEVLQEAAGKIRYDRDRQAELGQYPLAQTIRDITAERDELRHQLNVAKLQVQRAEIAGELMSGTLHGVRVTQHEQAAALRAIRSEASVSPDSTLKTVVQHILKELEL